MAREIAPVNPGEMLQEEFLRPLGLSQYALAKAIGVPPGASTRSCMAPSR